MGTLFKRSLSRWRGLSAVQRVVVCAAVVCATLWGGSKSNGANRAQRMHVDEADAATNTTSGVDGVTDLEERLDGTDPYDARNFRLRATLRVTDVDAGNGVTNLLAITQEEGAWNPAEVCAASTRDSFDYAVDIVVTGGVAYVNCLHDRIGNRDVDSEQERVKSVVLTASSQGRVMSFSVGDSDGDGVPDTREINEGTSPVDVKNFRLRATFSITDVDVGF